MKKLILLLLLQLPTIVGAQNIMSVQSFERLDNDMDARITSSIKDQNGQTCAIVKIETLLPLNEFSFDGGMVGIFKTEQKNGEIWVYQSPGARYISINHKTHFPVRQYQYFEPLKEASVYVMKLINAKQKIYFEESIGFQFVIINCGISGATITINNEEKETFVDEVFKKGLPFGKYKYEINAPMYLPYVGQFELTDKSELEFVVNLQPNFSKFTINTFPENDAEIYINNEFKGKTPYTIEKIIAGDYELKIIKPMYKSITQKIIISPDSSSTLNIKMQPTFSKVKINTDKSAEIIINNELKGKGYWEGRLIAGNYKIESRKISHHSIIKTIEVKADNDTTIVIDNPIPIYGNLVIDANEVKSKILIDSIDYGETPKIIKNILVGEHMVKLKKDGFESYIETIQLEEGKLLQINGVMNKITTAKVTITTDEDVYIYNNDKKIGQTIWEGELPIGNNNFEFRGEDNITIKKSFDVIANQPNNFICNIYSHVYISIYPENAKIKFNKNPIKRLEKNHFIFTEGNLNIEVSKRNYSTKSENLFLRKGEKYDPYFYLVRKTDEFNLLASVDLGFSGGLGFLLGYTLNRNGFYIHYTMPTDSTNSMESSDKIEMEGNRTMINRQIFTAGYIRKMSKSIFLYAGVGYGKKNEYYVNEIYDEYTFQSRLFKYKIKDKSFEGFESELGVILALGSFTFSYGITSTDFKYFQSKIGIGLRFGNELKAKLINTNY